MYLITTRPDIMYGVSLISRFMESPKDSHFHVGKRIFGYVAGTKENGILYSKTIEFSLIGYSNSDFVGNLDNRRSTSLCIFHCGKGEISLALVNLNSIFDKFWSKFWPSNSWKFFSSKFSPSYGLVKILTDIVVIWSLIRLEDVWNGFPPAYYYKGLGVVPPR